MQQPLFRHVSWRRADRRLDSLSLNLEIAYGPPRLRPRVDVAKGDKAGKRGTPFGSPFRHRAERHEERAIPGELTFGGPNAGGCVGHNSILFHSNTIWAPARIQSLPYPAILRQTAPPRSPYAHQFPGRALQNAQY